MTPPSHSSNKSTVTDSQHVLLEKQSAIGALLHDCALRLRWTQMLPTPQSSEPPGEGPLSRGGGSRS